MSAWRNTENISDCNVFIEKKEIYDAGTMKKLMEGGNDEEIKKFFFPLKNEGSFNLEKITQNQINKHLKVMRQENKIMLKELLKTNTSLNKNPQDIKIAQDNKTMWCVSQQEKQINQYFNFNQEIDFSAWAK